MKQILLIVIALFITACDPGYVINYQVSPEIVPKSGVTNTYNAESGITKGELRGIFDKIADIYGLSVSNEADNKNGLSYFRSWDGASKMHPRSISITVIKEENEMKWNINIFEWLVSKQTEFGANFEASLLEALSVKQNMQVERVE